MTINEYKHIVFGFEHYNPLGLVRSLGENGIYPIGIIIRGDKFITSKSRYLAIIEYVDTIEEGYNLLLEKYCDDEKKVFVYASDDQVTNYFDVRYDEIKDKCWFYNAGKTGRITEFQNKEKINKLAIKHGLNGIKTYVVNVGEIPEGIEYPIITKAVDSTIDGWKKESMICNNEEELKTAYTKIKSSRILLQKYIVKKNELCLDGCSVDRGRKNMVAIASSYNYLLPDAYSPNMHVYNFCDEDIRAKLYGMLEEVGFEGIFSAEFLLGQDDKFYFLEINFRNSGWSYAATIAGMPLPVIWANGMLDASSIEGTTKIIKEPFDAMVELDDYRARVRTGKMSNLRWVKEFFGTKCKYLVGRNDYKPVVSVVAQMVKRRFILCKGDRK